MSFTLRTTVHLRHTDAAGLVFFPRVLELAQDACEAFYPSVGLSVAACVDGDLPLLPIVRCEADFARPMRLGMALAIEVSLAREGRTSYALDYRFAGDDGTVLATARTVHVAVDRDSGRPVPLPAAVRQGLARLAAG